VRRIERDELPELAASSGFELSGAELDDYHELMEYLLDAFEFLEGQSSSCCS
jgi:hypothetical protein